MNMFGPYPVCSHLPTCEVARGNMAMRLLTEQSLIGPAVNHPPCPTSNTAVLG